MSKILDQNINCTQIQDKQELINVIKAWLGNNHQKSMRSLLVAPLQLGASLLLLWFWALFVLLTVGELVLGGTLGDGEPSSRTDASGVGTAPEGRKGLRRCPPGDGDVLRVPRSRRLTSFRKFRWCGLDLSCTIESRCKSVFLKWSQNVQTNYLV